MESGIVGDLTTRRELNRGKFAASGFQRAPPPGPVQFLALFDFKSRQSYSANSVVLWVDVDLFFSCSPLGCPLMPLFTRNGRRCVLDCFVPLVLLGLVGCSKPGNVPLPGDDGGAVSSANLKRIVLLTNGPDPFWDTCEAGAMSAEESLGLQEKGFRVDFQRGDFTDKKQIDMLKQYGLDPNVVAVGISVYNPRNSSLIDEMRALQAKGIKVVTIDSDVDREDFRDARFAYLGTDNFVAGRELGRAARAISPQGAKFGFFVADPGTSNAKGRIDGFIDGAGADFEEVDRPSDLGDRGKARKNVEDLLTQYPDVNMLVGIYAYNTPQIVNVVNDRKIRDQTKVICFDAAEASIQGMADGNVDVMIVQNPFQMGQEGVQLMYALVTEDQAAIDTMYPNYAQEGEQDIYRTELRVVVPDENSPVTKDLFDESTIFFKCSEFQTWLQDRSLISS